MIKIKEFARAFVVLDKLFVACRNEEGTEVSLYSICGAPVDLGGEEARLFLEYARQSAEDQDEKPVLIFGGQTASASTSPAGEPVHTQPSSRKV